MISARAGAALRANPKMTNVARTGVVRSRTSLFMAPFYVPSYNNAVNLRGEAGCAQLSRTQVLQSFRRSGVAVRATQRPWVHRRGAVPHRRGGGRGATALW